MEEYPKIWEDVSTNNNLETLRIRVPGGWMVIVRDSNFDESSLLFIADDQNYWKLES